MGIQNLFTEKRDLFTDVQDAEALKDFSDKDVDHLVADDSDDDAS